jgi:predicted TIM-barrel fold metal-dependent hydrolase
MQDVENRIREAVNAVRMVDTHEHLFSEEERTRAAVDFGYLFPHYASSDLVSAGMKPAFLESVRSSAWPVMAERISRIGWIRKLPPLAPPPSPALSLRQRWEGFAPHWQNIRNTGYGLCLRIAVRDIFGVPDLNAGTFEKLSDAIAASARPGWYRHVLKDKAGIEISIQDDYRTDVDRAFFAPAVRLEHFACAGSRGEIRLLEADTDTSIHALEDLVAAMKKALDRYIAEGAACVKIGIAYRRSLEFRKTSRSEADTVFTRIFRHLGEGLSWEEARPLQDFMFHEIVRAAAERGIPIQIHTGLQEGNGNILANSNPLLLTNLFLEYPNARFDVFHGGYPFMGELLSLAKNFPGVHPDLAWLYIISPTAAENFLHQALEMVPVNKILAFGGDFIIPEGAYGHAVMARQVVSRVLAAKVRDGYFSEEDAVETARMILRGNAAKLFGLKLV